jgi:beta-lactam-binding protein with PASTA domain
VIGRPAEPGERLGVVVDQFPKAGTLSSWDTVRIVVPKPTQGVVPRVVGLSVQQAQEILSGRHLVPVVESLADGNGQVVLAQSPQGNVAAMRRMVVRLRVGRG